MGHAVARVEQEGPKLLLFKGIERLKDVLQQMVGGVGRRPHEHLLLNLTHIALAVQLGKDCPIYCSVSCGY